MNSVTIREFQANAAKYLTQLPLILTRYGMPVARITAVDYEIKDVTQDVRNDDTRLVLGNTLVNVPKWAEKLTAGEKPGEELKEEPKETYRCEIKGCGKEAVSLVTYQNPETFDEETKLFCPEHLKKIKSYEVYKEIAV